MLAPLATPAEVAAVKYKVCLAAVHKQKKAIRDWKAVAEDLLENHRHVRLSAGYDVSTWWFPADDHYQTEIRDGDDKVIGNVVRVPNREGALESHITALTWALDKIDHANPL